MTTIYALASAKGRAGVAVMRLSGEDSGIALASLSGRDVPPPRQAALRSFVDPHSGMTIDRGLAIWFPGPASFTGEDVAELHLHGGPSVIAAMAAALDRLGLLPAEPGEFSRRAFEHGKLDLTEAEGIADLVNAETEAQRLQALRQMDGALGAVYEGWRGDLIRALAFLEADLDFPDEDLPGGLAARVMPDLQRLSAEIRNHLADERRGEALRDGFQIVITGAPNVGKSSLLNALARRDVAIVSEIAGTTRDIIEVRLDLGGYPVTLVDTAGLRDSDDIIEQEGVRRARARAQNADLRLQLHEAGGALGLGEPDDLIVINKVDIARPSDRPGAFLISVRTGEGIDALLAAIEDRVVGMMGLRDVPSLTRARHRRALEAAAGHLDRACAAVAGMLEPELVAEDVRLAARALGRITGRVDVEDLLDVVFGEFCIGK
ncbi:tRNA uridine-5-carboxymethylaminomethyl(34) synthesis GTPase MnmE [Emcibacter sp. SYSU 3D8]|uniref:tRNA uridine-5-carboxymethylaminomethyl(34) synthesis GTPase MnmE n=1 Tax=Emcibacter sp. SYSU 3D8 TaxID=3133969 RepID=UPI0031FE836B